MIAANNGILIVTLVAFAFALAGLSYLVNIADEHGADKIARDGFWGVFAVGLAGYAYATARLLGYV